MPYHIVISNMARKDIRDAVKWEDMRKPGLSEDMLQRLNERITQIAATPGLGNVRYKNIRCTPTKVFSYLIHYIVDDDRQTITIARMLHTSRKPIWE